MKVRFAFLADYSNVTREGKLNVLGLFDVIRAFRFPVEHNEMQLVIGFEADISEQNEQKHVQVRLIDSEGQQVLELEGDIHVGKRDQNDPIHSNQVLVLRNLVFQKPGLYQFDIYIDGIRASSVPLKVVLLGHQAEN